jgi:hypothetical protein
MDTPIFNLDLFEKWLNKRQVFTNFAPVSVNELSAMCPLNNVTSADVAAGCIAGIYNKFCKNPYDPVLFSQCQDAYDRVFAASFFKPLGDVCPAWKQGPRSAACLRAISTFLFDFLIGKDTVTGQNVYLKLTSAHANKLVGNIFGSRVYAPCPFAAPKCNWS